MDIEDILDLDRYPLDRPDRSGFDDLVAGCRADLAQDGLYNLSGLIRADAVDRILAGIGPVLASAAFTHRRRHNIYFKSGIDGLAPDHPALAMSDTVNHTICADQFADSPIIDLYEWPPFAAFLAATMGKPALFTMADPLARVNVMAYRDGDALGWHFDRSEFTMTLLLQAPEDGGAFEYVRDLRSQADPNYEGVGALMQEQLPITRMPLAPGTLNVFRGHNTAHRVSPVQGDRARIIAVFSYFDRPGVVFSDQERFGFYGRSR